MVTYHGAMHASDFYAYTFEKKDADET